MERADQGLLIHTTRKILLAGNRELKEIGERAREE
jgi:hypothetical protein